WRVEAVQVLLFPISDVNFSLFLIRYLGKRKKMLFPLQELRGGIIDFGYKGVSHGLFANKFRPEWVE
ncbi:hypothetical protein CEXT_353461, partial [Caerostris extrusa]